MNGNLTKQEQKALDALDKARSQAKPITNVHVATQYGVVLFEARGKLDITPSVVAVPLPMLFTICAELLSGAIVPMLQQIPAAPLDTPVAKVMESLMNQVGGNGKS